MCIFIKQLNIQFHIIPIVFNLKKKTDRSIIKCIPNTYVKFLNIFQNVIDNTVLEIILTNYNNYLDMFKNYLYR